MVTGRIRSAPFLPQAAGQALLVEGSAYIRPFLVVKRSAWNMPEKFPGFGDVGHQNAPFLNAFFGASSSLSKNFFSLLDVCVLPSRPSYSST